TFWTPPSLQTFTGITRKDLYLDPADDLGAITGLASGAARGGGALSCVAP
ncbi:hypothetical protein M9458_010525, partial [Cirrhinus mrigala]